MNARIETPELMIYAMAAEIENFNTVLHGLSTPLPILAISVSRNMASKLAKKCSRRSNKLTSLPRVLRTPANSTAI